MRAVLHHSELSAANLALATGVGRLRPHQKVYRFGSLMHKVLGGRFGEPLVVPQSQAELFRDALWDAIMEYAQARTTRTCNDYHDTPPGPSDGKSYVKEVVVEGPTAGAKVYGPGGELLGTVKDVVIRSIDGYPDLASVSYGIDPAAGPDEGCYFYPEAGL